jgi:hypothetical protein
VEALAALLEPEAFDETQSADEVWRGVTQQRALSHAAKVLTSGYRRVLEDDDTIERLARAIHDGHCGCGDYDDHLDVVKHEFGVDECGYRDIARVVVRALREDT